MDPSDDQEQIRLWLETAEGLAVLEKAARRVRKKIVANGIPFSVIDLPQSADSAEADGYIASEMALFILENRSGILAKLTAPEADRGRILTTLLFRHLMDRGRSSPHQHPPRYLYKHAGNVLRQSPEFHTRAKDHRSTLFSLESESREIGPVPEDERAGIPWPPDLSRVWTLEAVSRKKHLELLARWFWKRVSDRLGGSPVWVPLRDLVYWIGGHFSLKKEEPESLDDRESAIPCRDRSWFDPEKVRLWAEKAAGLLAPKQRQALYLLLMEKMSQKDVAARLGWKGPSNTNYHRDQAVELLQSFTADLPWLSPDGGSEANDTARDFFMECLLALLKKQLSVP
jgi:hypothetical protein